MAPDTVSSNETALRGLKTLFWIVGALLLLIGLVGWYDRLAYGHQNANYGSIVTWGLWVAAYIYCVGLSAGSFLIAALAYVFGVRRLQSVGRLAVFTALVSLILALLFIWVDLGHMGRFWHLIVYSNLTSPMAWMIWIYALYGVVLILMLWRLLRRDLVLQAESPGLQGTVARILALGARDTSEAALARDRRWVRTLGIVGIAAALLTNGAEGSLFGVVSARPYWHSGSYPLHFLLGGLLTGTAAVMVLSAVFQSGWRRHRETILLLGKIALGLLLLELLFQLSELLVGLYGELPGNVHAMRQVLQGPYWWVFWIFQLGAGWLVPLVILLLPTRRDPRWVAVAGLFIAIGFLGVRVNIVIPGLAVEELRGLTEAFVSARLTTSYFPSPTEWLVAAGLVGLGMLLFGIGETLFPTLSAPEEAVPEEAVPEEA